MAEREEARERLRESLAELLRESGIALKWGRAILAGWPSRESDPDLALVADKFSGAGRGWAAFHRFLDDRLFVRYAKLNTGDGRVAEIGGVAVSDLIRAAFAHYGERFAALQGDGWIHRFGFPPGSIFGDLAWRPDTFGSELLFDDFVRAHESLRLAAELELESPGPEPEPVPPPGGGASADELKPPPPPAAPGKSRRGPARKPRPRIQRDAGRIVFASRRGVEYLKGCRESGGPHSLAALARVMEEASPTLCRDRQRYEEWTRTPDPGKRPHFPDVWAQWFALVESAAEREEKARARAWKGVPATRDRDFADEDDEAGKWLRENG